MGLAEPLALSFGALAGILLYLHWQARRKRAYVVPALFLWPSEPPPPRRHRWDWLLLLQLLALAALVVALAQPFVEQAVPRAQMRHVLVVDRTASMQARLGAGTRFQAAVAEAQRYLAEEVGAGDTVGLIALGEEPELLVPPTADVARVSQSLGELVPYDSAGSLAQALALARSLQSQARGGFRVAVFSDFADAALPEAALADAKVFPVGEGDRNLAITAVEVHQRPWQPARDTRASVRVRNYGSEPSHGLLLAEVRGQVVLRTGFTLAPGEEQSFLTELLPGPGELVASLVADDLLAVDNVAWAWVAETRPLRVCFVSPQTERWSDLETLAAATGALRWLPRTCARNSSDTDVFVFHRTRPPEDVHAPALVLAPPPDGTRTRGRLRDVALAGWNSDHPVFAGWSPAFPMPFAQAQELVLPPDAVPLLWGRAGERTVLLGWATERQPRQVWLGVDAVSESLLAPDAFSLAVTLLQSLAWLDPREQPVRSWSAGKPFPVAGLGGAELTLPDGARDRLPQAGIAYVPHWRGRYEFHQGAGSTILLVSAYDAREAAIAPQRVPASLRAGSESDGATAKQRVDWARAFLLAGLVALALEAWLARARAQERPV